MNNHMGTIKYLCIAIGSIVGFGLFIGTVQAETEFMTSWQAKTYVPEWYTGKVLPTYQSFITVGFDLIEDGRVANLSKTAVRWYVDGKLVKNETNGLGIRQIGVFNKKYGGAISNVRISIPDYKGSLLEKSIDIPIKSPEVVIDVPYFQKKVARGTSTFYAWPFFFNVLTANNLNLQWTVDGSELQTGKADASSLRFTAGSDVNTGSKSAIEASVINGKQPTENIIKKVFVEIL